MNIRQIAEQKNWYELYNAYAVWIQNNKWAWKNGGNACSVAFDVATTPYGMREFFKQNFGNDEKNWINFEAAASKQLNKYPESFQKKADIFASVFPGVIGAKLKKISEADKKTSKTLNEFFEQQSLPLNADDAKLSEIAQTICAFAKHGAKSVKSPDGWEVQF
jgi:uncharacterized protein YfeS